MGPVLGDRKTCFYSSCQAVSWEVKTGLKRQWGGLDGKKNVSIFVSVEAGIIFVYSSELYVIYM